MFARRDGGFGDALGGGLLPHTLQPAVEIAGLAGGRGKGGTREEAEGEEEFGGKRKVQGGEDMGEREEVKG